MGHSSLCWSSAEDAFDRCVFFLWIHILYYTIDIIVSSLVICLFSIYCQDRSWATMTRRNRFHCSRARCNLVVKIYCISCACRNGVKDLLQRHLYDSYRMAPSAVNRIEHLHFFFINVAPEHGWGWAYANLWIQPLTIDIHVWRGNVITNYDDCMIELWRNFNHTATEALQP